MKLEALEEEAKRLARPAAKFILDAAGVDGRWNPAGGAPFKLAARLI